MRAGQGWHHHALPRAMYSLHSARRCVARLSCIRTCADNIGVRSTAKCGELSWLWLWLLVHRPEEASRSGLLQGLASYAMCFSPSLHIAPLGPWEAVVIFGEAD